MAVANYNRKILDLKRWTMLTAPAPAATAAGAFVISSRLAQQRLGEAGLARARLADQRDAADRLDGGVRGGLRHGALLRAARAQSHRGPGVAGRLGEAQGKG